MNLHFRIWQFCGRVCAYYGIIRSFAVVAEALTPLYTLLLVISKEYSPCVVVIQAQCEKKAPPLCYHGEGIAQLIFLAIPLYVRRFFDSQSDSPLNIVVACEWAALRHLCSLSNVMTCTVWLVSALRMGVLAGVRMSRYYSQMSLDSSHEHLHQPSPLRPLGV